MSKSGPSFTCSSCGAAHRKWAGRCDACGAWNSILEEAPLSAGPKALGGKGRSIPLTDLATVEALPPRASSGIDELDRVLGGGLVPASAILVGGASIRRATNSQALLGCFLFHLLFIVAPAAGKNLFG